MRALALLVAMHTVYLGDAPTPVAVLPKRRAVTVQVPDALASDPFEVERRLVVPEGFAVRVYARVPNARFVLVLPSGDALVSQPRLGRIVLLRPTTNASGGATVYDYATRLEKPHDMVLAQMRGRGPYVYVSEEGSVARYVYVANATRAGRREVVVRGLPNEPDLRHPLKNIAVGGNGTTLYVSIGSATNDDPADLEREPKCGAIYAYALDGKGGSRGRLVSQGVRNAEGLAFAPGTDDLWAVVNQRDNVKYPYHDTSGNYGKRVDAYVDENPPEEFVRIVDGSDYGWPFCNPVANANDADENDLGYVADAERNPNGSVVDCARFATVAKGLEPHSAPLGLTFWSGPHVPALFRDGALVGMHGSWNRRTFSGHKVAFFPWKGGRPGRSYDLVSGWVTDPVRKLRWGRPVDTGVLPDGSLLVTDDFSGTVYRLYDTSTMSEIFVPTPSLSSSSPPPPLSIGKTAPTKVTIKRSN